MKKNILTIIILFISTTLCNAQEFITVWDLSKPGSSPTQLSFGVGTTGIVNYTWETIPAGSTGSGTFTGTTATISSLPASSKIRLKIDSTNFIRINMNGIFGCMRLVGLEQWGNIAWSSMANAFHGCGNLIVSATDIPNLSSVTDMSFMFCNASLFNQAIGNWNVSNVTNMSYMFNNDMSSIFNQPIGNWNVSNVTNMSSMFSGAVDFNQPISNWNVGNVTNMSYMFSGAIDFNQPIDNWDVSSVTNMSGMFSGSSTAFTFTPNAFNQPISSWDVSNVTNMSSMFSNAPNFNQPLANWNVSSVTNMSYMFSASGAGFASMVYNTYNLPLDNWDVSNVTDMNNMFSNDTVFNQSLSNWNVNNVTNMGAMFLYAKHFNQSLSNWSLHSNVTLNDFLSFCGMDCTNYSGLLNTWANNINTPSNRYLGAFNVKYGTNATTNRNYLINTKGWTITNDVASGFACCVVTTSNLSQTVCDAYFFNNQTLTSSGVYYDTLINSTSCDSIITLNLTITPLDTSVIQAATQLTANANSASYQWIDCSTNTIINGATNKVFNATQNGSYAVIVSNGTCSDTSACHTVVGVGTKETIHNTQINVFPNPAKSVLYITCSNPTYNNTSKELCNALGQVLYTTKSNTIDVHNFAKGVYYIKMGAYTKKVVIE